MKWELINNTSEKVIGIIKKKMTTLPKYILFYEYKKKKIIITIGFILV